MASLKFEIVMAVLHEVYSTGFLAGTAVIPLLLVCQSLFLTISHVQIYFLDIWCCKSAQIDYINE